MSLKETADNQENSTGSAQYGYYWKSFTTEEINDKILNTSNLNDSQIRTVTCCVIGSIHADFHISYIRIVWRFTMSSE